MDTLLQNAINSIQIGIEDYQSKDSRRSISAVRNYYAGILLLAKAVLVKACPNVPLEIVLASRYKPKRSTNGDLAFEACGTETINFNTIKQRFNAFGLKVNHNKLEELQDIRNNIEHKYTKLSSGELKAEIAKTFEVLVELCAHLRKRPVTLLGEKTWKIILDVHEVYKKELEECQDSFTSLELVDGLELSCPDCHSELIYQKNKLNKSLPEMKIACKSCRAKPDALVCLQHSIRESFTPKNLSYKELSTHEDLFADCPDCNEGGTYVMLGDFNQCLWCEFELGECPCGTVLTPDNVSLETLEICSYCSYKSNSR
jgi:hypothetical protein